METTARRLVALDLDDTLAPIAKPASEKAVRLLKDLLSRGDAIVLCSGKPLYYLTGFARQLGLEDIYLIGENGATLQRGVALPPSERYVLTKEKEAIRLLKKRKEELESLIPGLYFQPNDCGLTPFPTRKEDYEAILAFDDAHPIPGVRRYRQCDSIDFAPADVDKGKALAFLAEKLGIPLNRVYAIGNAENDAPMLSVAGTAIKVGNDPRLEAAETFDTVEDALSSILRR